MLSASVERVLASLDDEHRVLDVGGWAQPLRRADAVVDILPYESRGPFGTIGTGPERFSESTWFLADVNRRLPFEDLEFDYVVCSHTLEDIRDPLALCAELQRVARRGYVEVPSRLVESTWGIEGDYVGYYHHRWMVDLVDGELQFRFKPHSIHGSRRFHLPRRVLDARPPEDHVVTLFWDEVLPAAEVIQVSRSLAEDEMVAFARQAMGDEGYRRWVRPRSWSERMAAVRQVPALRRLAGRPPVERDPFWDAMPELRSEHGDLTT